MSVHPHGRGRFAPANVTVFHDRLSRKVSASREPHAWQGVRIDDAVLPDGSIRQVVLLGPQRDDGRADVKSMAIPLSSKPESAPRIVVADEGKVFHGSMREEEGEGLVLVRQPREGYVTRIFTTGLIRPKEVKNSKQARGFRQRDLADLRTAGIKIGYHGIFPLELGSAKIAASGETVEVMTVADVFDLTDENARKFKGFDVPESRDMAAEIPIGGAVLCADLGFLTVHERGAGGNIKIYDVTDDKAMWVRFQAYVHAEMARQLEEKKKLDAAAKAAGQQVQPNPMPVPAYNGTGIDLKTN